MTDVNVYYTERVEITDLPAYLDEKYVEYEIKVEKKDSITGALDNAKIINSIEVSDKHGKVMLTLRVQGIKIKNVSLSIFERVVTKVISLKSTVSETCMEKDNICSFELKLNVYMIDKVSNKPILLDLKEIENIASENNLTLGYFIKRRTGKISTTSKETIGKINNPELITNKYIKYVLEDFKKRCNDGTVDFPRLLFKDLMKSVFEHFLKDNDSPDNVINEIGDIFGTKVNDSYMKTELRAFYHIYEALVPKTLSSPGYDKIQHFTYCVKERYNTSKLVTDAAQYIAEAYDLINGGSWDDTLSDMEANNLGQAYGKELYDRYHKATVY
ncbi:TPA: hypothetical protein I8271_005406 [Kluyvera intermedia]|uniref:Uncharacterized protein n=2 Tax=Enterobacteriaceae TaxID=543 RepID=A0AAC8QRD3_9ENTR|nr:hypothetical protein [Phytobacter ursingii]HAT2207852.1 hypothetical protein [Kluyvera intermedia]AKL13548.1 hypothetical protein AB182_20605 [Phytobacter ursingii]HAT2518558.1 hypothetical protein [Kluyvera intermedia]HAT2606655.1 hypothetical protein [Kluyvera intermedia]HAT2611977.1 hypothetical protein [Kluyvera intermedia]